MASRRVALRLSLASDQAPCDETFHDPTPTSTTSFASGRLLPAEPRRQQPPASVVMAIHLHTLMDSRDRENLDAVEDFFAARIQAKA
jgi:hypothetical protein